MFQWKFCQKCHLYSTWREYSSETSCLVYQCKLQSMQTTKVVIYLENFKFVYNFFMVYNFYRLLKWPIKLNFNIIWKKKDIFPSRMTTFVTTFWRFKGLECLFFLSLSRCYWQNVHLIFDIHVQTNSQYPYLQNIYLRI